MLESLKEKKFAEKIFDERFGGEGSLWWIIVSGNLDQEIYHRGPVAAYLRVMDVEPWLKNVCFGR